MSRAAVVFAKFAGLQKLLAERLENPRSRFFDPKDVSEYYDLFIKLHDALVEDLPDLYADLPRRDPPIPEETSDHEGRGYVKRKYLQSLYRDIGYIFEVQAHSELVAPLPSEKEREKFRWRERAKRLWEDHRDQVVIGLLITVVGGVIVGLVLAALL